MLGAGPPLRVQLAPRAGAEVPVRGGEGDSGGGDDLGCGGQGLLREPRRDGVRSVQVRDEVRDRDERQAVGVREDAQVVAAQHGAVVVDEFGDDGDLAQIRQAAQLDARLRVAGALAHPAVAGDERQDMAGPGDRGGVRGLVRQSVDGDGAVRGADPRRDAGRRVAGDGVGGALRVLVHGRHGRQVQRLCPSRRHRRAHDPRGVPDDEPHPLRSHRRGGHDEVALVLAVLVIDDDDGPPVAQGGQRGVDGVEADHDGSPSEAVAVGAAVRNCVRRAAYFAMTSTSTLTASSARSTPMRVAARVTGMRLTSTQC